MSKCNKKPKTEDSFWGNQVDYNKTACLTYETLKAAADKMGISNFSPSEKQYQQNIAYIKGKQWIDITDPIPPDISKPCDTSGSISKSIYEPPSEPISMRDIYKHTGKEKKPGPGDCAPHPQAGVPVTDTGDWPWNKLNYTIGVDMVTSNPAMLGGIKDIKEEDE